MKNDLHIPKELQEAMNAAVSRLETVESGEAETEDILHVLAIFNPETQQKGAFTAYQQRVLLLAVLTFRHILVIWQRKQPNDMRAVYFPQTVLDIILRRVSEDTLDVVLDALWERVEALKEDEPILELIEISAYTLAKAVDNAVDTQSLCRDYPLETHIGVALRFMARAYVEDITHHEDDKPRQYRLFWRFWFTQIVPRAWYTLSNK